MEPAGEEVPERTVVVVTGGDPPDRAAGNMVPEGARVVAADSGASVARSLGLLVNEAVGDFDSISPPELQRLAEQGASIEVHERDKDATDLELALSAALRSDPTCILVLGGLGGRLDHELANLLLLSGDVASGVDVTLRSGHCTVRVVRPGRLVTISGTRGELVSLVAVHGPATGVTTDGLRWPLVDAALALGTTLGVSNELIGDHASVTCAEGVVLVVQPGVVSPFVPPRTSSRSDREVSDDR